MHYSHPQRLLLVTARRANNVCLTRGVHNARYGRPFDPSTPALVYISKKRCGKENCAILASATLGKGMRRLSLVSWFPGCSLVTIFLEAFTVWQRQAMNLKKQGYKLRCSNLLIFSLLFSTFLILLPTLVRSL
ncbi:hypothetical protein P389DRAFT_78767 [Cystobasidium minutum MCA 4210]|uniref:uncharacterized protein n=1 Tax=Cystobasidium minutum MCA 4210 TaxID=1397322 RepID=UPI0034CEC60C|eukprot:jgi/Rhomi1/78767/CE78766_115